MALGWTVTMTVLRGVTAAVLFLGIGTRLIEEPPVTLFRQVRQTDGKPTTWTFQADTDDSVVTLLVDGAGTHEGMTPHGYVQVQVKAQDEVHDAAGKVTCLHPPCSSITNGYLRAMSQQFNRNEGCVGTQCPGMVELFSDGALRLTAGEGRDVSIRGSARLAVKVGEMQPVCIDSDGVLSACP